MPRKKKSTAARLEIEARRRHTDAGRLAAKAQEQHLAEVRRALREGADRAAFERRLAAAMAVTNEFAWTPWGYEIPAPSRPAGLSVRHLRAVAQPRHLTAVPAEPNFKARQRFERPARVFAAVAA